MVNPQEAELEYRTLTPRALVTRTCRSELVAYDPELAKVIHAMWSKVPAKK